MNFSVVIIILLPMVLDVVCSDENTRKVSSVLELFPEFVLVKEKVQILKKGLTLAHNRFKNYRVKREHSEGAVAKSARDCWIKCIVTVGCTAASFQTEGGTCELSSVAYISYDVLTRAVGWDVFTRHTPVVSKLVTDQSVTFTVAKPYCESQGLSFATLDDLIAAKKDGYQIPTCGYVADDEIYKVSEGVLSECDNPLAFNVYCTPRKYELKNEIQEGGQPMTLDEAKALCASKSASLATMEDMLDAYHMGFQNFECGWVSNGNSYLISQNINRDYKYSIGIIACTEFSRWNAWCKLN